MIFIKFVGTIWIIPFIIPFIMMNRIPCWASDNITQIHVTLLGQPCLLEGKYKESILRSIHAIGPAQVDPNIAYPDSLNTTNQLQATLDKIQKAIELPTSPLLDSYKQRLEKRLKAQIVFLENIEKLSKKESFELISKAADLYILSNDDKERFKSSILKLAKLRENNLVYKTQMDQIFEVYNGGIAADPQDDFYSALKKLGIHYSCSLEYNEESQKE